MATKTLKTLKALEAANLVSSNDVERLTKVENAYAIGLTDFLAGRIASDVSNDPIRKMFVPDERELLTRDHELIDPIGDKAHTPVPGIIHRYPNRVLLKPVGVCPVYCRFCFRREMVGPDLGDTLNSSELENALDYIRQTPEISEVILTGGDPFMVSASRAETLTQSLSEIEHVDIIRWHTRMPVADPSRITNDYIAALASTTKAVFVSIHINHIQELSNETKSVAKAFQRAGIHTLSQTVLLNGVNDSAETLASLMQALLAVSIRPYLLHHPDLAKGTGHFWVDVERGQDIYQDLKDRVSGLALPRYVIDIPGGVSKANAARSEALNVNGETKLRGRDGKLYPHIPS